MCHRSLVILFSHYFLYVCVPFLFSSGGGGGGSGGGGGGGRGTSCQVMALSSVLMS